MAAAHTAERPAGVGKPEFITMMALLMALNALAIDILIPALQQIGAALAVTDENSRQLTLTAYVATFGLSQIIFGPVSDAYGRKKVLISGMIIYIIGALLAALATDFTTFLALRALQGFGAGALRTVTVAIVRDIYKGRAMASVVSLVMMVFMTVPVIAPAIGQAMEALAGWRSILLLMAVAGLLSTVWVIARLAETLPSDRRRPLEVSGTMAAFRMVLENKISLGYALAFALTIGTLFAFLNSAQQIYGEIFSIKENFPIAFAGSAIVMGLGSFLNARLVGHYGMRFLAHSALVAFVAVNFLFVVLAITLPAGIPFWAFYVLVTLSLGLFSFTGPNFNALAMEPMGHIAGTASAVIGSIQTVVGALFGAIIGLLYDGTLLPLAAGFLILAAASLCTAIWAEGGRLFKPAEDGNTSA